MNKEEQMIQTAIIELLSYHCKKNKFVYYSIPNESIMKAFALIKDKIALSKIITMLKKTGLTPGACDIAITKEGRSFFLELKQKKGTLSENQDIFISNARKAGAICGVAFSFDEARLLLKKWGII